MVKETKAKVSKASSNADLKHTKRAKYVEPRWQFVKYATHRGYYSALTRKGTKFYHVLWFGNGFPISCIKVPLSEAKYFYTLGPVDSAVQSWARFKRSVEWTKAASAMFSEAEAYVKQGGM